MIAISVPSMTSKTARSVVADGFCRTKEYDHQSDYHFLGSFL